jgi:hypothetical protein
MGGPGSGRKPGSFRVKRVMVECLTCFIHFPTLESAIAAGGGKFCSVAHYREFRRDKTSREVPEVRRVVQEAP